MTPNSSDDSLSTPTEQNPDSSDETEGFTLRTPSVRHPRSFYDIFIIDICLVALVALEFVITRQYLVRVEVITVATLTFFWNFWAVFRILDTDAGG